MKKVVRGVGILLLLLAIVRISTGADMSPGRFNVVPVGDRAILVDTASGETWILATTGTETPNEPASE